MDEIERAIAHPAHRAIRGFRIVLGECGMLAYLSYMAERLAEVKRVLKPDASVYLHCDPAASHYLKALMDGMFTGGFRRELIWNLQTASGYKTQVNGYVRGHDVILYYVQDSGHFTFNRIHLPHKPEYVRRFRKVGEDGRRYRDDRPGRRRQYLDSTRGVLLTDVWSDIMSFQQNSLAKEYLGYPTQKPSTLLERVVEVSSNPGDVVLDPFCGCGTTVAAARKLNRRFVGIDISHFAIDLIGKEVLQDASIPVHGVPVDIDSAARMARENRFEFEKWAITRISGMVPNERQTGDGGVDGRGRLYDDGGLVLAQVKSGRAEVGDVRHFCHTLHREDATCGVFTTLYPFNSPGARAELGGLGGFKIGATPYPKGQLWSIQGYFQNHRVKLPPLANPVTGDRMHPDMFGDSTSH